MAEERPAPPLLQGTRLVVGLSRRASRAVAQAAGARATEPQAAEPQATDRGVELAVGAATRAVETVVDAGEMALGVAAAVGRGLRPLIRPLWNPAATVAQIRDRGRTELDRADEEATRLLDVLLPELVEAVLVRLDLTELVRRHVDLDTLAAEIDLDAAASRVDVDRIAARLDIDAVAARLDLDAIVARLDLDAAVSRVDIDRIAARLDLDAVAARLDLDRIVSRLDLESIVRRLDLNAVVASVDVDAIASRVDLDAIVARLDLIGLAEVVIDGVDLAEIIRSSSGSVASEAVRDVRIQSIEADQAVSGFVDRLIGRRARPRGAIPAPRQAAEDDAGQPSEEAAPDRRAEEAAPGQRAEEATSHRPGEGRESTHR